MTNARVAAARALLAVERREATLASVLDATLQTVSDARDRALVVELTTGGLRWRNEIDALIASASRRSVRQIDARVLAVLRIGVYQLRHLDRVPDHAIVHESVDAVRTLKVSSAAGFVNAVLHAIIRRGPSLPLPGRPAPSAHKDAQVTYLSTTLSHPAWLVRRWIDRLGFDAAEVWCRFNNTPPDLTIRSVDDSPVEELIARLRAEGVAAEAAPHVADAVRLPAGTLGRLSSTLRERIRVQDEGAQLIARFANVHAGERVLDLCAAPGGKTLVMASDMRTDDPARAPGIVASDHRAARVALLRQTLQRVRLPVPVVRLDGRASLPFGAVFDCVVIDAPCSGLGTVRREPDLKWTRTVADLPAFASDQRLMLTAAAEVVRPGGRIVYATCSSEPDENVDVVDAFLAEDTRFTPAATDAPRGVPSTVIDERGHLVTRPDRHDLEAFYAAVLVRRGST